MIRDLVVFGEDWHGLPSSTQHLIKHLSLSRKIVWINSIGLRKPKISISDLSRMGEKLSSALLRFTRKKNPNSNDQKTQNSENIYVYNLISLPAPKYRWERFVVKKLLSLQLKPLVNQHNLKNVAIWTSLPTASDLIDEFPGAPYIYYCCDDFSGLAGVDHSTAMLHESKITERSDLIVASSKELVKKFNHKKCHHLPHGVDLELFSIPTAKANDLPNNGKPTAGFYGSIAPWLDIDLLKNVISRTPDWNFVFIGDAHIDISPLKQLKNTFFLGPRPHAELPSYSQHWQASLLPFKDNAQIRACNPLKLKEYLAAGSPVISTLFPAVKHYKSHISIIQNAAELCHTLDELKATGSVRNINIKNIVIEKDTWSEKAKQLESWIDDL